jgi:hypothetical protein
MTTSPHLTKGNTVPRALLEKRLGEALDVYTQASDELDHGLNPFSAYDAEIRQPALQDAVRDAADKLADLAYHLLDELANEFVQ